MTTAPNVQAAVVRALRAATDAALAPAPGNGPVAGVPGAAALIAHRGAVIGRAVAGAALAFGEDGPLLPESEREPVTPEHLWDIASLTKVTTCLAALVLLDRGSLGPLGLDTPVVDALPEFADGAGPRAQVRVRHLLTHTAGLPPRIDLVPDGGAQDPRDLLLARVLSSPVGSSPGTRHVYSCVGYVVLGLVLEAVTGTPLPQLVADTVAGPLGLSATGYLPAADRPVVPTEVRHAHGRGLVRGEVHDTTAWALGGVGNAGLFSDVEDLLRLGEELRTGAAGLLRPATAALMRRGTLPADQVAALGYDQAFGLRVGPRSWTGTDDPAVLGHTGFTGTSLMIDTRRELTAVLLTNAVHPSRTRHDVTSVRLRVAEIARAAVDDDSSMTSPTPDLVGESPVHRRR